MRHSRTCDPWASPESLMETCWRMIWNRAPLHSQIWKNAWTTGGGGGRGEKQLRSLKMSHISCLTAAWEGWVRTGEPRNALKRTKKRLDHFTCNLSLTPKIKSFVHFGGGIRAIGCRLKRIKMTSISCACSYRFVLSKRRQMPSGWNIPTIFTSFTHNI